MNESRRQIALKVELEDALTLLDIRKEAVEQIKSKSAFTVPDVVPAALGFEIELSRDIGANLRRLVFHPPQKLAPSAKRQLAIDLKTLMRGMPSLATAGERARLSNAASASAADEQAAMPEAAPVQEHDVPEPPSPSKRQTLAVMQYAGLDPTDPMFAC